MRTRTFIFAIVMKNTILQWIESPERDYQEGVGLLTATCENKSVVRVYQNTSARFGMNGLVKELEKIAKRMPDEEAAPSIKKVARQASKPEPKDDNPTARKAKDIIHEEWVKMSKKQEELYQTGTSNDANSLNKRQEIMKERDEHVERYNEVYEAKEEFYAGKKSEAELQQVIDGETKKEEPKVIVKSEYAELSDLELAKKIKATKQAITRDTNMLEYQQPTAAKKPNPMPKCPKRNKTEERIKAKKAELEALQEESTKRGL